ncbi:MAG: biotin--[acetyl-CoA-carboxylase] ligase [Thermoanaerobaculia bacterium]
MDFARYLEELPAGRPRLPGDPSLVVLERVGSTNTLARRIVAEYEKEDEEAPAALLVAYEQTAGRGRQGRSWASPPGKGVYVTLVRRIAPVAALPTLPLLVGVGLCRALGPFVAAPCRLKWPNDLRVEGRKIGGVLVEVRLRPEEDAATAIIGFGVNLAHGREDLPEGVGTSLALEGAAGVALPALTWGLVAAVMTELETFGDVPGAVARYRALSEHEEGDRLRCRAGGEEIEGTLRGFDEQGRLRLEVDGTERRLAAGEVVEP